MSTKKHKKEEVEKRIHANRTGLNRPLFSAISCSMEITDNSHPGRDPSKAVSQPTLAGTNVAAETPPVTVTAGLGQLPRKKRRLSRSSRRPSRNIDADAAT